MQVFHTILTVFWRNIDLPRSFPLWLPGNDCSTLNGPNNKMLHSPRGGFFCPSSSPDKLDSVSPMMKAQYTAALPQLDYFPGLPYIIQNPPLCVISCQFFEEQSSQGRRGNFLPQNFQFVSSHIMPGLAVQQITLSAFKTVHISCLLSCCQSFVINFFFSPCPCRRSPTRRSPASQRCQTIPRQSIGEYSSPPPQWC